VLYRMNLTLSVGFVALLSQTLEDLHCLKTLVQLVKNVLQLDQVVGIFVFIEA
jgi:hypothetical protein